MLYLGFYFIGIVFRSKPDSFYELLHDCIFYKTMCKNTNNLGVRIYNA